MSANDEIAEQVRAALDVARENETIIDRVRGVAGSWDMGQAGTFRSAIETALGSGRLEPRVVWRGSVSDLMTDLSEHLSLRQLSELSAMIAVVLRNNGVGTEDAVKSDEWVVSETIDRRLKAMEHSIARLNAEVKPGEHSAGLSERVTRIDRRTANMRVVEALCDFVKSRGFSERASTRTRYELVRRSYRDAYGEDAWRETFRQVVEQYDLSDYIFDQTVLRDE